MDPLTTSALAVLAGALAHPALPGETRWWACVGAGAALLGLAARRWWALVPALAVAGLVAGRSVGAGPALEGPVAALGVRVGAGSGRTGDVRLERPIGGVFAPGRVRVRFPGLAPPPGAVVVVVGEASPVAPALPGAPDPIRAAALSGVRTAVRATAARQVGGDPVEPLAAASDPTGLLRALLLGDTSGCDPADLDVLRRTGTTHLLSVSGFHVGVAAVIVRAAIGGPLRAVAMRFPRGVPTGSADAVSIVAAWAYAAMAGMPVPAQRAAAALTLVALGRALGRRTAGVPALAAVAAALAVMDPGSVAGASFQLSFGAMAGLVVVTPRLVERLPDVRGWPWPLRAGAEATVTTLGTTLATLPAAAWWFQAVPPLAVPANLVAMPLLGLLAVPCAAAACWAPGPLAALGAGIGTALCRLAVWLLGFCAVEPWTPAVGPVGAVALTAAVALFLARPWAGTALAAACLWPCRPAPVGTRVTFLDVGQGDAALVERPDGRRLLIDGGAHPTAVVTWLRRRGVRRLDAVVQTHPDRDHAGGLPAVVTGVAVDAIWAHDPAPDLAAAAVSAGVPLHRWHPAWTWPERGSAPERNESSIVLEIDGFLFTGDVGAASEALLAPELTPACVLKVPHHGSDRSTTPALLAAIDPVLAVVSVGRNPYGHPAPRVLDDLRADGARVRTTLEAGTLEVERRGDDLWVRSRDGAEHLRCR
jgi:competence protein ComEC